jgi:hypothetical protein
MLELFSRLPETVKLDMGGHLTPVPSSESTTSLSAILLDDSYYESFMLENLKLMDYLQLEHLI